MGIKVQFMRILEFIAIFCIEPVQLYWLRLSIAHNVVLVIVICSAACLAGLLKSVSFDRHALWRTQNQAVHVKSVLVFFLVPAIVMTVLCCFVDTTLEIVTPLS